MQRSGPYHRVSGTKPYPININAQWKSLNVKPKLVYESGIVLANKVGISHYFILFTIILVKNHYLPYSTWLKLMKIAKNYKKRGKITLKGKDLSVFLNNKRQFEEKIDKYAANPMKWYINVIKGD